MLSPRTKHTESVPIKSFPMTNAWASPSGEGCSAHEKETPIFFPSPKRFLNPWIS